MAEPRLAVSRPDTTAADSQTLEQMGYIAPQPLPAPQPEPPSVPDSTDEAEEAALEAALSDAGVTATAGDRAAVHALARLDAATVEAVTRWLKTKKDKPETLGGK